MRSWQPSANGNDGDPVHTGAIEQIEPLDHTAARLSECAVLMSAQGSPIRPLNLLAVPTDEVLFAVFTADSANVVSQTCDRAGIPAQRVTTATEVDLEGRL